jgi:hypothetical protein
MGKKTKEHNKKIKNRNLKIKENQVRLQKSYFKAQMEYSKQIEELQRKQSENLIENSNSDTTKEIVTTPEVEAVEISNDVI